MQAVRPSLRALHATLVQHLRVPVKPDALAPLSRWGLRMMSEEAHAHGTYLDRGDVVDRVLAVVKSNQKVDPSKVCGVCAFRMLVVEHHSSGTLLFWYSSTWFCSLPILFFPVRRGLSYGSWDRENGCWASAFMISWGFSRRLRGTLARLLINFSWWWEFQVAF